MNIRKRDNDIAVIKQLAEAEARKVMKADQKGITSRKGLTFIQSYEGGGPRNGINFGDVYDGPQIFVRGRAYGVSGATYGVATDVLREKLVGKGGVYLYDGFSATNMEIRYSPINEPLHVLMSF